jgi:hypothetical protein
MQKRWGFQSKYDVIGGLKLKIHQYNGENSLFNEFRIKCDECSGICCVALYYSKFDGFPADKVAGIPCHNLDDDFRCSIHKELHSKHLKGCMAYDCCGAGQIVTSLYGEENWKSNPQTAEEVFDVFIKTFYLQQMLWYLSEVLTLQPAKTLWEEAANYIEELHLLLKSSPSNILSFDMDEFGVKVNLVLNNSWTMVKKEVGNSKKTTKKKDFMGYNFKKANLNGYDFSTALLIAANLEGCDLTGCNFLGADMRDTNIKNADLSEGVFLTQGQINAAKGNINTHIPEHLVMPSTWL